VGSPNNFNWSGWAQIATPSALASAPTALSNTPRLREVFYYQNSGGAISLRRQFLLDGPNTWIIDPPIPLPSNTLLTAKPFVASFGRGNFGLFTTLTNGSVRMIQRW